MKKAKKTKQDFEQTAPPVPALISAPPGDKPKLATLITDMVRAWEANEWGPRSNENFLRFLKWAGEQIKRLPHP